MRRAVALEPHSAFNQKALALLLYKSHKLPESIGAFQVRACVPTRLPHVGVDAAVDWEPSGVRTERCTEGVRTERCTEGVRDSCGLSSARLGQPAAACSVRCAGIYLRVCLEDRVHTRSCERARVCGCTVGDSPLAGVRRELLRCACATCTCCRGAWGMGMPARRPHLSRLLTAGTLRCAPTIRNGRVHRAHPCHICTGTGLTPATSAPGLAPRARTRPRLTTPSAAQGWATR